MAVKKGAATKNGKNSGEPDKNQPGKKSDHSKLFALLFFTLVLLVLSVIGMLIWKIPEFLMYKNPRFVLKRIDVQSTGYWQGKSRELASKLGLKTGDNVFTADVGVLREKVLEIKSIEDAEVQIVLPDMISFKLAERVPRAVLAGTGYAIDEKCNIFKCSESVAINRKLPEIYGFRGGNIHELKPSLSLIVTSVREYKDIDVENISVRNPQYISAVIVFRNYHKFQVLFPNESVDFGDLLNKLQNAVIFADLKGNKPIGFDLRNRGQVVLINR